MVWDFYCCCDSIICLCYCHIPFDVVQEINTFNLTRYTYSSKINMYADFKSLTWVVLDWTYPADSLGNPFRRNRVLTDHGSHFHYASKWLRIISPLILWYQVPIATLKPLYIYLQVWIQFFYNVPYLHRWEQFVFGYVAYLLSPLLLNSML